MMNLFESLLIKLYKLYYLNKLLYIIFIYQIYNRNHNYELILKYIVKKLYEIFYSNNIRKLRTHVKKLVQKVG